MIKNNQKNKSGMTGMKHKIDLILVLTLSFLLTGTPVVSAGHSKKHITPYGDFCTKTSHYGIHHDVLDNKKAKKALKHYYGSKGLDIEVTDIKGRFLKVLVKDNGKVVDKVIFDRRTGRIRSVY
jgi:hypothetical protein